MRFNGIVFILCCLTSLVVAGQSSSDLDIRFYTKPLDKLHGYANDFASDDQGYLWFVTNEGLKRFDGRELIDFDIPGLEDLATKQPHVLKQFGNKLWIGTTDGVLSLNINSYKVKHYGYIPNSGSTITDPVILDIFQSKSGVIWLSSYNGLSRYDSASDSFKPYYKNDSKTLMTSALAWDSLGKMWVSSPYSGLHRFNPANSEFTQYFNSYQVDGKTYEIGVNTTVRGLIATKRGNILLTLDHHLLEIQGDKIISIVNFNRGGVGHIPQNIVEDRFARIWVSFKGAGFAIVNLQEGTVEYAVGKYQGKNIPEKHISKIRLDQSGDLVLVYMESSPRFYNMANYYTKSYSLDLLGDKSGISSMLGANRDLITVATKKNIASINRTTGNAQLKWSSEGYIRDALLDADSNLWVASDKSIKKISSDLEIKQTIDLNVNDIAYHQNLGVAAIKIKKLYIINKESLVYKTLELSSSSGAVSKIYSDPDSGFWFLAGHTVFNYSLDNELHEYTVNNELSFAGANLYVAEGKMYILGKTGIDRITIDSLKVGQYELEYHYPILKDSLKSMEISNSKIWVANASGDRIYALNGKENSFELASTADGFANGITYETMAEYNDELFLSKGNDIQVIPNGIAIREGLDYPLKTRRVTIESSDYNIKNYFGDVSRIVVEPQDKFITFHFSDNSLRHQESLGVQLKLEGRDRGWHRIEGNYVTYSGLEPGEYQFKLRSALFPLSVSTLGVLVRPPFWRTWWAYFSYATAALIIFGFCYILWREKMRLKSLSDKQLKIYAKGFEYAAEGFCVVDANAEIVAKNIAFKNLSETNIENLRSLNFFSDDEDFYADVLNGILNNGVWNGHAVLNGRFGTEIVVEGTATSVEHEGLQSALYMFVFNDVTLKRKQENELIRLTNYDGLTGLANRNLFTERLNSAIRNSKHISLSRFGIIYINVDRFKSVNDSFSQDSGDELLQMLSNRLSNNLREQDSIARLGGDEFCVIIENVQNITSLAYVAKLLIDEAEKPFCLHRGEILISLSVGISVFENDTDDAKSLLRQADVAMQTVKAKGGGNYSFYTTAMNSTLLTTLELESDMRKAVKQADFLPFFQPKVDIDSGKMVGAEALVRWIKEDGNTILPDVFIEAAERTGTILKIGDLVLLGACNQLQQWHDIGIRQATIAVNLSVQQIVQNNFLATINKMLEKFSFNRGLLEFEITENLLMEDREKAVLVLAELRSHGHVIYIDDFGTGYSSLSYLADFPIDYLKIDKTFIDNMLQDTRKLSIVNTIVELAKNLNLKVVAEGVEEADVRDYLKMIGCQYAQGYLYAKAMDPAELMSSELFQKSFGTITRI